MKKLVLFIPLLFSLSCATNPLEKQNISSWKGKAGYFSRPVEGPNKLTSGMSPLTEFNQCMLTKIVDINIIKNTDKLVELSLVVEQKGKRFAITKINRLGISSIPSQSYEIKNFDRYFVDNLKNDNRKIFMRELGKALPASQLACSGIIWTKMSKEQFLFIKGRPNQIKIPSSARENLEDWYYFYSQDPSENKRFRFLNSRLQNWGPINPNDKSEK